MKPISTALEGLQPEFSYQKQNFSCIYRIYSKATGNCYIGSAKHFGIRRRNHLFQLSNNKHHSKILQNHVNKHGIADLCIEVLENVEWGENVVAREQFYLDSIQPYFNVLKVAYSTYGRKITEETRQKLVKSHLGKKVPPEQIAKMKILMTGRTFSADSLQKMKDSWRLRKRIKPVICVETGVKYPSVREAEKLTGCDNIYGICTGERGRRSSKGFTFRFINNGL